MVKVIAKQPLNEDALDELESWLDASNAEFSDEDPPGSGIDSIVKFETGEKLTTGAVYHDPDGAGGTAQTRFARILGDQDNFGAGNIFVV